MRNAIRTAFCFPFFCVSRGTMLRFNAGWSYFATGILVTWTVGIGRWWDDSEANLLQKTGFGSVIYVFMLAFFLWVMILPMRPRNWTYPRVLVCVTLTALPGIVYAFPVESFMSSEKAARTNLGLLALVATWRVALLVFFVRRLGELTWLRTLAGAFFPLELVAVLIATSIKLNMSLLRDMAGIKNFSDGQLAAEAAANVVSEISSPLFVPLLLAYGFFAILPILELYRPNDDSKAEIAEE